MGAWGMFSLMLNLPEVDPNDSPKLLEDWDQEFENFINKVRARRV
jgi:hypothetical protein